jgi:hypothetical protein
MTLQEFGFFFIIYVREIDLGPFVWLIDEKTEGGKSHDTVPLSQR